MKINIRLEVNRTDTDRQTITVGKSDGIKIALLCAVSVTMLFGQNIMWIKLIPKVTTCTLSFHVFF